MFENSYNLTFLC